MIPGSDFGATGIARLATAIAQAGSGLYSGHYLSPAIAHRFAATLVPAGKI